MGQVDDHCLEWRQGEGEMRVMLEFPEKAEDEGFIIRGVREMMLGMLQEHLANRNGSGNGPFVS